MNRGLEADHPMAGGRPGQGYPEQSSDASPGRPDSIARDAPAAQPVVASLHLSSPDGILAPTLASAPAVTIRPDLNSVRAPDPLYISVTGADFEPFESALLQDSTVSAPRRIRLERDRREYAVVPTRPPTVLRAVCTGEHYLRSLRNEDRGWVARLTASSRVVVSSLATRLTDSGIAVDLRELHDEGEAAVEPSAAIPPHHEALLRNAYDLGYFEIPRGCTQADLAEEFDITSSAVSHQLRKAVGNVIECAARSAGE